MDDAALLVGLIVFGGAMLVIWRVRVGDRRSKLDRIAGRLQGGEYSSFEARGRHRGIPVVYRFASRGAGSSAEAWTEIDADVPAAYPLAIHVRHHQRGDQASIDRGEATDVKLGHAGFDAAFLVEAAPADIARLLLDAPACGLMLSHDSAELDTGTVDGRKVLRFAARTWIEDDELAFQLIQQITAIVARVRDSFATAEAGTPQRHVGSPFRAELDDQAARDAAGARAAEVAALEAQRAARIARARLRTVYTTIVVLGLCGAFAALLL